MPRERRNSSGAEKMAILRAHLIEKVPVSEVCEKHGVQPTLLYQWQRRLFEEGTAVFEPSGNGGGAADRLPGTPLEHVLRLAELVREGERARRTHAAGPLASRLEEGGHPGLRGAVSAGGLSPVGVHDAGSGRGGGAGDGCGRRESACGGADLTGQWRSAGETQAGSGGVQPTNDSRPGVRRIVARGGHRKPPPNPFVSIGAFPHALQNASTQRRSVRDPRGFPRQFRLNRYNVVG